MAAVSKANGSHTKGRVNGSGIKRAQQSCVGNRDGVAARSRRREKSDELSEQSVSGSREPSAVLCGSASGIEVATGNDPAIYADRIYASDCVCPELDERESGRSVGARHEGACVRAAAQLLSFKIPRIESWQVSWFAAAAILILNIGMFLAHVASAVAQ